MALTTERIVSAVKVITSDIEVVEHHGDVTIIVPRPHLLDVLNELKDNPALSFEMLVDVTAVDLAKGEERFEVVYFLTSLTHNTRLRIKTRVREDRPHLPTVVDIWESANWYERETYDMYGIIFDGHPDLRRFFMPEDFVDENNEPLYPLRKDFPLMGIPGTLPLPSKEEV